MKKSILLLLVISLLQTSCSLLSLRRFSKCDFELKRIENLKLADIDISKMNKYSDFTYVEAAKVAEAFLKKELLLSLTFVVDITNSSRRTATLEKMDYQVYVEDQLMAVGTIKERVEVPPQNVPAPFFVKSDINIVKLTEETEIKEIVLHALALISSDNIYDEFELKVKPYIRTGNQFISAPGFIKVKRG